MARGPASPLLRSAIRADMEARIEGVAARLEASAPGLTGEAALERAFETALREVLGIAADGLAARLRESSPPPP